MISSLPEVVEKIPDVKLMIVGDGPAMESLKQQVIDLKLESSVIFTGEVDNEIVANYYHMADLFVSTSISESQGLTYIEALASGLRVVATHSPYTDKLLNDEDFGATFSSKEELIQQIIFYLDKSKNKIGQAKLDEKLDSISADNFGDRILQFYADCKALYGKESETSHSSEIG